MVTLQRTVRIAQVAWLAAAVCLLATPAAALVITDDFNFATYGQSMWSEGSAASFFGEVRATTQWGLRDSSIPSNQREAETLTLGGIAGKANDTVAGTGEDIPNPAYLEWKVEYDVCRLTHSENTCINGKSATKVCKFGVCVKIPGTSYQGLGREPAHTLHLPALTFDSRSGVKATILTSGEAGLIPWVKVSAGEISATLPVGTKLTLPDTITQGTPFTVSTQMTVKDSAAIATIAPFFKAGVDGVINMDFQIDLQGCIVLAGCDRTSSTSAMRVGSNGRFGIVGLDTKDHPLQMFGRGLGDANHEDFEGSIDVPIPKAVFDKKNVLYYPSPANPDGVDDPATPEPKVPSPRLGDITVYDLENFTGGNVTASALELTTNQKLVDFNLSMTGLAEFLYESPGFLSNKVELPLPPLNPKVQYTLLDVGVGPRFGMQQEFDLTPDAWVRLEFNRPVTDGNAVVHNDGVVELALGTSSQLTFGGDVGDLVKRTYFMKDPQFTNVTAATIDPGMSIDVGCMSINVIGDATGLNDALDCAWSLDAQSTGLADIPLYSKTWTLGGFNQYSAFGTDSTSAVVPAPSTLLLLALALPLLGYTRSAARRTMKAG